MKKPLLTIYLAAMGIAFANVTPPNQPDPDTQIEQALDDIEQASEDATRFMLVARLRLLILPSNQRRHQDRYFGDTGGGSPN